MTNELRRCLGDWKTTTSFDYLAEKRIWVNLFELTKYLGSTIHPTETNKVAKYLEARGWVEIDEKRHEVMITEEGLRIYNLLKEVEEKLGL